MATAATGLSRRSRKMGSASMATCRGGVRRQGISGMGVVSCYPRGAAGGTSRPRGVLWDFCEGFPSYWALAVIHGGPLPLDGSPYLWFKADRDTEPPC